MSIISFNANHKKRLAKIIILLISLAVIISLVIYAFNQNINMYFTPAELLSHKETMQNKSLRLGGFVLPGSVKRSNDLSVVFTVTDFNQSIEVNYTGMLPDLFREGQGVVVAGELNQANQFKAHQVLAKHDERYTPT